MMARNELAKLFICFAKQMNNGDVDMMLQHYRPQMLEEILLVFLSHQLSASFQSVTHSENKYHIT